MSKNPRLFGIVRSNRDYAVAETWGKNQFNSSFPASLACYFYEKNLKPVYIKSNADMESEISYISVKELFGVEPLGEKIYFNFEAQYSKYQKYVIGSIPRNDLVIMSGETIVSSLEIKLVALPDQSTCELNEDKYGSEIVVRPDTIIYLACSIIHAYQDDILAQQSLRKLIDTVGDSISDWTEPYEVIDHLKDIYNVIKNIVRYNHSKQIPLIMEPIWKTEGKTPKLAENCLDIFVWSNLGMLKLFMPNDIKNITQINRHTRTMIWLFKMLKDYANTGKFNGKSIIDDLTYNTKNDKAFASNGLKTYPLMTCQELKNPRIMKNEIKNIILGGGQNLLSPERRFDAIIYNSPDLFK